VLVLFFQVGYPASGGGFGSPTYSANWGIPLTFAYEHTVNKAGSFTTPFVLLPLNLIIDFIIWSTPWFLFLGLFKTSSYAPEQRQLGGLEEAPGSE
jgi:hypothetical protein